MISLPWKLHLLCRVRKIEATPRHLHSPPPKKKENKCFNKNPRAPNSQELLGDMMSKV